MNGDGFTVGVFAPMPSELRPVVRAFGLDATRIGEIDAYVGTVAGTHVVAVTTGMGTALASAAADGLLEALAVDHALVVGIAGGVTAQIGDLLVPETVVDGASGAEYRAHPFGGSALRGRVSTSDEFIVDPARLRALADAGVEAVDMETAAIAAVCEQRAIPWTAFRVISDMATESEEAILGLANADGSPNALAALRYMARKPWRVPYLVRLGRDSARAADAAAGAASAAVRAHAEL
ncbi:MAG TPA: hypothetical protein VI916_08260 [Acidimicrobiia bacterium]|nr:hypothetical protein [Acidimicrobiia bacterium]